MPSEPLAALLDRLEASVAYLGDGIVYAEVPVPGADLRRLVAAARAGAALVADSVLLRRAREALAVAADAEWNPCRCRELPGTCAHHEAVEALTALAADPEAIRRIVEGDR